MDLFVPRFPAFLNPHESLPSGPPGISLQLSTPSHELSQNACFDLSGGFRLFNIHQLVVEHARERAPRVVCRGIRTRFKKIVFFLNMTEMPRRFG